MLYDCKLQNDIVLLCETSNAFIHALCLVKMIFHQRGLLKLIKTMLKSIHVLLGLSSIWNGNPKGSDQ